MAAALCGRHFLFWLSSVFTVFPYFRIRVAVTSDFHFIVVE